MGALEGRVAIITGAGRGLGREHALLFAAEGARVVVNDAGSSIDGSEEDDASSAESVVEEIRAAGGEAIASVLDVADWEGGRNLVDAALEAFGDLHVLVNNAGILRDRMIVNMSDEEWDSVVRVHLKGCFVPTHFATSYWRSRTKDGHEVNASVTNTTSTSGLRGNPGQAHYGAAKAGVAAFTLIAAQELAHYGVRVNAVTPVARTRMTTTNPGLAAMFDAPEDPATFDGWDPANVSPLVAYLSSAPCTITGRVFYAQGGKVQLLEPWRFGESIEKNGRWGIEELGPALDSLLD